MIVLLESFYTSPRLTVWARFNICEFAFYSFIVPIIPTSRHLGSVGGGPAGIEVYLSYFQYCNEKKGPRSFCFMW